MLRSFVAVLTGILLVVPGGHARAGVVDHPHLSPVRTHLVRLTIRLKARGIDPSLLLDKAREGVVKRVPPARILQVVRQLARHLQAGKRVLRKVYGARPPAGLLKAYGAARLAGVDGVLLQRTLQSLRTRTRRRFAVRVVDTLSDLSARGYRGSDFGPMVEGLLRRGRLKQTLRLRAALERITRRYGLSRAQSAGVLRRAFKVGGTLRSALRHLKKHPPGSARIKNGPKAGRKSK